MKRVYVSPQPPRQRKHHSDNDNDTGTGTRTRAQAFHSGRETVCGKTNLGYLRRPLDHLHL